MSKGIVIVGAGGHGKVIADIAKKNGYEEIIFLDDNCNVQGCAGYTVVGTSKDAAGFMDYDFAIGIGNAKVRQQLQAWFESLKLHIISLMHPSAVIADGVTIGKGTVVMAGVVINSGAIIGKGCILNTCSSIDHDCVIGNYVHVSVGSHIAGSVTIGDNTWIGAGATISNNVDICDNCMIGAGAVVIKDIKVSGTYIGVPAKVREDCKP